MPFTPKFVDLVRSLTTVTGTGAASVGSTVTGFTGLSAAVAAGEQFYYCIQGVDKPAEREVGRGTMQINGSVVREAIGGPPTNFTAGTKTIALIAAAEWFAKVEGGAGSGGGMAVASLAELAALPTASGAAVLMTAAGREGLFVFDAANLSGKVTADTRKGIYVAPTAGPTGASGAWVRKFDGAIEVNWFGTAADFVTDDLPAFDGALAVIKARTSASGGGGSLHVRAGRYFLNGTVNVHVSVAIFGDGSGQGNGGTLLRFPNNVNGVVFNYGNTHGDGAGTQGDSTGSRMEGIQLWGGGVNVDGAGNVTTYAAGDSTSGHGVRIRTTFVTLRDVFCAFFGGDGFHINCTAGSGPLTAGNANDFTLDQCQSIYNRGFGYLANGTDANAGTINTCSAISNGGGGFIEYSFLGNSYIQCHARDNGKGDPTNSGGAVGICTYGGNAYYMAAGQEAAASTVVPGTDAAVWVPYYGGGASKAWVSGLTWANPSPYGTNPANSNGRNVFLGCYAESGQAPCQAFDPSLFLGGLLDEVGFSPSSSSGRLIGTRGGMLSGGFMAARSGKTTIIGEMTGLSGPETIFRHDDGTSDWRLVADGLSIAFTRGGSAVPLLITPDGPEIRAGKSLLLTPGAAPAVISDGRIWYDSTAGKFKKREGGATSDLDSGALLEASAAEIIAGAVTDKFISPDKLFDAAAPVALTDGATIAVDASSGINFNVTLGGNRTLANPTNMKPGQSGRIRIKQDATGGRTLGFGANWLFAGGDPVLSTAANAIDVIAYFANAANEIEATIAKALA